jgi:CubicO group peptidase (beta-lactamase class C family)
MPKAFRRARRAMLPLLMATVLCNAELSNVTRAEEQPKSAAPMEARARALIPDLEAYIQRGMKAYDLPGLAFGIVAGDRLVYAKGFGVRSKAGGAPVDTRTAFQIGSLTKGFLATTMAIMVDRGKVHWDDRVVDRYPAFQLQDAWVTREFRIFDLMAQRSGLRPLLNDVVGLLGYAEPAVIRSLLYVEPVSSFRTTFAYTNVTHLLTGRIVANLAGAPDWNAVA